MERLLSISSIEQIEKYQDFFGGWILGTKEFTSYASHYFSIGEIKEVLSKGEQVYILLNCLLHNSMLGPFKEYIKNFKEFCNVHFIVQDLGGCQIIKKVYGTLEKTIFNPVTLITNHGDANDYASFGFEAINISNEIRINDVEIISQKCSCSSYMIFGYHPMYQSYRPILSLYKEYYHKSIISNSLKLKEQTRNDFYPVIENDHGSVIFRDYVCSSVQYESILQNLKYEIYDSIFLSDEDINYLVNVISEGIDVEQKVKSRFLVKDGFLINDSIYEAKEF